jgi:8-oxo-dGTP pyrophosphatase MutT (NUDIX family)
MGISKRKKKTERKCDIDCAVREFCEETRLNPDDIEVLIILYHLKKYFLEQMNVLYKHTYYVAKIKIILLDISIDKIV